MKFSLFTDIGKKRNSNEDNYLIKEEEDYVVVAVADGMGGHRAGDVASKMAVEYLDNYEFNPGSGLLQELRRVIKETNAKIIARGEKSREYAGMGTTLSAAVIYDMNLYKGHVGDSRIYLYRESELRQLSEDHSLVNELLQQGRIAKDEVFNHPQGHILTEALGIEREPEIDSGEISLQEGDQLLFCTDGLTDMLRPGEIEAIFNEYTGSVEKISERLGKKALENGGRDNITLITGLIT